MCYVYPFNASLVRLSYPFEDGGQRANICPEHLELVATSEWPGREPCIHSAAANGNASPSSTGRE
jgi:hypothetical protein